MHPSINDSIRSIIRSGEEAFQCRDWSRARELFHQADDLSPENPEILNNLAVVAQAEGNRTEALALFRRVLEIDPGHIDTLVNLAQLLPEGNGEKWKGWVLSRLKELAPEEWKRLTQNTTPPAPVGPRRTQGVRILILNPMENRFAHRYGDYFRQTNEVRILSGKTTDIEVDRQVEWADLIWSMWANELLIYVTNHHPDKKIVSHLRSYEMLHTDFLPRVHWPAVDRLIFVADHVRRISNIFYRDHLKDVPQSTIVNSIPLTNYPEITGRPGKNIAYVGYLNPKKGIELLLQTFQTILKTDPCFRLHVAGSFQEIRTEVYVRHILQAMDLTERVTFHGWVEYIPSFLRDMNYVISTSQWEGCPNNILEAMACGIRPIIHNWMGARELFPEECVFSSLEEVPAMLAPSAYHAERYRTWIEERFNTADTYPAFDAILASVLEDSHR